MDGLGLKEFVGCNPINSIDPSGLLEITEAGKNYLIQASKALGTSKDAIEIKKWINSIICSGKKGEELLNQDQLNAVEKLKEQGFKKWLKGIFAGQNIVTAANVFYQLREKNLYNLRWTEGDQWILPDKDGYIQETNCWGFLGYLIWLSSKEELPERLSASFNLGNVIAKMVTLETESSMRDQVVSAGYFVFSYREKDFQLFGTNSGEPPYHIGLSISNTTMLHLSKTSNFLGGGPSKVNIQSGLTNPFVNMHGEWLITNPEAPDVWHTYIYSIKADPTLWTPYFSGGSWNSNEK